MTGQDVRRRWYAVEGAARHDIDRSGSGSVSGRGLTGGPQDVDIRGLILAMPARAPWVQHYPGQQSSLP
jgi:hypothetical protein